MRKKYEDACKEAGLSEEKIRQIRRLFERDREKLKYEKKQIQKYGCFSFYFSESGETGKQLFNIADPRPTPEEECILQDEMKRLRTELAKLSAEDRELLMAFYDKQTPFIEYVRSVDGNRAKMLRRKERLLKILKEKLTD